jgi:hypothetical protein
MTLIVIIYSLHANENPWISKYPYLPQLLCVSRGNDLCDQIYDPCLVSFIVGNSRTVFRLRKVLDTFKVLCHLQWSRCYYYYCHYYRLTRVIEFRIVRVPVVDVEVRDNSLVTYKTDDECF